MYLLLTVDIHENGKIEKKKTTYSLININSYIIIYV